MSNVLTAEQAKQLMDFNSELLALMERQQWDAFEAFLKARRDVQLGMSPRVFSQDPAIQAGAQLAYAQAINDILVELDSLESRNQAITAQYAAAIHNHKGNE
jgi:hypothetical protein